MIARWLAAEPQVLLLNDPTRGIDIGAKRDLYALLTQLAGEGMAVVMLSTELDEHVELMDRVLVFREHELARRSSGELSRAGLISGFFGRRRRAMSEHGAADAARAAAAARPAAAANAAAAAAQPLQLRLRRCCSRSLCSRRR